MTSLQALSTFFGWTTVINFVFLAVSSVAVISTRSWIPSVHGKVFGLESADLSRTYFQYIAQYKIAIIVFSLTPHIALRLMA